MGEQRVAEHKIVAFCRLKVEIRIWWRALNVEGLDHEVFLARVELAHKDRGVRKHRMQVTRHASSAAGKIEDFPKVGPVGGDHGGHDQVHRTTADPQVMIKVSLEPRTYMSS